MMDQLDKSRDSRLQTFLKKSSISAFRDLAVKRPSFGQNIDALDGVRGLAVLIVILSHTDCFHLIGQGGIGVWLFFSLSGFLLTLPFTKRPNIISSSRNVGVYFLRRARRILPMYLFVLTSILLFQTRDLSLYLKHVFMIQADGHFWTIPQEILFYLILPGLVGIIWFVFRGKPLAAVYFLSIIAILANLYFDSKLFCLHGNGKCLRFYAGIFLTGMVFAYFYSWTSDKFITMAVKKSLDFLSLICLFLFFVTARYYYNWFFDQSTGSIGWRYSGTFGFMCGFVIYVSVFCDNLLTSKIMSSLILRGIGLVSFSMYLLHPFVVQFIGTLGFTPGAKLFFLTLVLTYALSVATYGLIERPFLRID
jgi:peptidoglycan/LPS O-acetylase OafA/YrhL